MARRRRNQQTLNWAERDTAVRKLAMRHMSVGQIRRMLHAWAHDLTADAVERHGADMVAARIALGDWLDWQLRQEAMRLTEQMRRLDRMKTTPVPEPTEPDDKDAA